MKILIVGFGRMGVSHAFQILGSLGSNVEITVIDPSLLAKIISKILLMLVPLNTKDPTMLNTTSVICSGFGGHRSLPIFTWHARIAALIEDRIFFFKRLEL